MFKTITKIKLKIYLFSGSNPQMIEAAFKIQLYCKETVILKKPTMKIEHKSDSFQSSHGRKTVITISNGASNQ